MNNKYFLNRLFFIVFFVIFSAGAVFSGCVYAEELSQPEDKTSAAQKEAPLITSAEVKARLDRFEPTIIVDVRSLQEYNTIHISGAMSVPLENMQTLVGVFPKDMGIVFY